MMEVKEVDFDAIDQEMYTQENIIYGAGYNGRLLYEMLTDRQVSVVAFYDDDESRWGEVYYTKKILSKAELAKRDMNNTNILIANQYTAQIISKVQELGFSKVYTVLDKIVERDTEVFRFYEYQNNPKYLEDLDGLIKGSSDAETKQYFEVVKRTLIAGKALPEIAKLCSIEKQYFLKCFKEKLNGIHFIDAGAYTGDTVREMKEENIQPAGVYCFEADYHNYTKLKKYIEQNKGNNGWFCENYALWDTHTKLGMSSENFQARVDINSKEAVVETVTIDDYFQTIQTGFIKMDIEGAERRALAGGMKTIKRDRPILAISIYHSVDDIVEIPRILMNELEEYDFIVRKHANTYAEAILYGFPKELKIVER